VAERSGDTALGDFQISPARENGVAVALALCRRTPKPRNFHHSVLRNPVKHPVFPPWNFRFEISGFWDLEFIWDLGFRDLEFPATAKPRILQMHTPPMPRPQPSPAHS